MNSGLSDSAPLRGRTKAGAGDRAARSHPAPAAKRAAPHRARQSENRRQTANVGWDDVSVRSKVGLIVMGAATAGMLIGLAVARYDIDFTIALGALMALVTVLLLIALRWIGGPIDQLVQSAQQVVEEGTPARMDALPKERGDEIGAIAQQLHTLASAAFRDGRDAQQLRRTLDARIEAATRRATTDLERLANRDALTTLGNRRFLDQNLPALFDSSYNAGVDLVAIAIDLDHFKQVNDRFGHAKGDELLIALAKLLRASVREDDWAVRLGGDEFLVLMPACEIEKAEDLAKRLSALFRQQTSSILPASAQCSLSIGIASLHRDRPSSPTALIEAADARLYKAKRAGRAAIVA